MRTAQTAQTAQSAASWLDKLSAEDRTYAESKGWKSDTPPDALLSSYKNLEKVWGADKAGRALMLPKDANDTAALDAIYDKLGRPADPSGYEISLPEGVEPDFADKAKGWFHKAGLSTGQAKAVTEAYQAAELEQAQALEQRDATEKAALEKEWGAEYTNKVETAKRGIAAAGAADHPAFAAELGLQLLDPAARALQLLDQLGIRARGGSCTGPPLRFVPLADELAHLVLELGQLDRIDPGGVTGRRLGRLAAT